MSLSNYPILNRIAYSKKSAPGYTLVPATAALLRLDYETGEDYRHADDEWGEDFFIVPISEEMDVIDEAKLQSQDIWLEFSFLGDDPEAYVGFANKYGPLGLGEVIPSDTIELSSDVERSFQSEFGERFGERWGESAAFWREVVGAMAIMREVWENLRELNSDYFRERISFCRQERSSGQYKETLEARSLANSWWEVDSLLRDGVIFSRGINLTDAELLRLGAKIIMDCVNHNLTYLRASSPRVAFEFANAQDASLVPAVETPGLLAEIWYQLGLSLLGDKVYKRCSICGKWRNVTGLRSDSDSHPECSNRERQRRLRERKEKSEVLRLGMKGQPASKIASKLGKDQDAVKLWIGEASSIAPAINDKRALERVRSELGIDSVTLKDWIKVINEVLEESEEGKSNA